MPSTLHIPATPKFTYNTHAHKFKVLDIIVCTNYTIIIKCDGCKPSFFNNYTTTYLIAHESISD
eukprot:m.61712 g.61712  ORF g.61712 m.61712 type:complete len:64 (+) comp8001_c0_seq2:1143-1334(+)